MPIIGHLEGLCHTYIDKDAELKMATEVVYNAKLRNTSICGATETILMHKNIVKKFSTPILQKLENGRRENAFSHRNNLFLRRTSRARSFAARARSA